MNEEKPNSGSWASALFALVHVLCCGIPLLILSGVSLAFLRDRGPAVAVVLAIIGLVGFLWYLERGCAMKRVRSNGIGPAKGQGDRFSNRSGN